MISISKTLRLWSIFLVCIIIRSVKTQSYTVPVVASPCPSVLEYEAPNSEQDRWYGSIKLSTDFDIYGIWIDVILDKKADLLGNWFGDVTTKDNKEFKIVNRDEILRKGTTRSLRFFVKFGLNIPRVSSLRLNGREICSSSSSINAHEDTDRNRPLTSATSQRPLSTSPGSNNRDTVNNNQYVPLKNNAAVQTSGSFEHDSVNRPDTAHKPSETNGQSNSNRPSVSNRPSSSDSVRPHGQSGTSGNTNTQSNSRNPTASTRPSSSSHNFDDYENSEEKEDDYFSGDFNPSSSISKQPTTTIGETQCGKVQPTSVTLITGGQRTSEGQYPWHVAIYRTKHVDSTYICGGSLISQELVVTAAHCVTRGSNKRPINPNILTLHFGKYNLRTSVQGVQLKFVNHIYVHPDYASSNGNDIAVLKLREPVEITTFVRPICLWPDDLTDISNVVGKTGAVVGWGFDEEGRVTEDLRLAQMPVIDELTCIRSFEDFFVKFTSNTTYCAGYLNGTSVCNGDSGGGMVFALGSKNNPTWYLRGLVSLSAALQNEARCDPSHYIVFTDVAKYNTWIKSFTQPSRSVSLRRY